MYKTCEKKERRTHMSCTFFENEQANIMAIIFKNYVKALYNVEH